MTKNTERYLMIVACGLGLFALLVYTFVHTGALLARYVRPWWVGYVAAFGVELIIAAMAWRLSRGRTENLWLTFALVIALFVSAFANVYEGHAERYGEQLTITNVGQIDPIQAVIGVFATGLISLLVFAISDIVGSDVKIVVSQTERKQRRERKAEQVEQAEQKPKRPEPKGEQTNYQPLVFSVLANEKRLGPTAMGERVGCSKATAKKWIDAWDEQRANGAGVLN